MRWISSNTKNRISKRKICDMAALKSISQVVSVFVHYDKQSHDLVGIIEYLYTRSNIVEKIVSLLTS